MNNIVREQPTPRSLPFRRSRRGWIGLVWVVLLLLVSFVPPATYAQDETWLEQATVNFTILYATGSEAEAQAYAGFVDSIYEDIATTFNHRTAIPLTLRLYPTFESYYQVNPVARDMPGVVAHADFRHREVAVVLPQTEQQSPDQIQNNVRHELTHIVASDLSNNQLNTGFQEGLAQYMELPTPDIDHKKVLLRQSYENSQLMNWSAFDDRNSIYGNPELGYPQTLSVVSFLVETYGFDLFRDFLTNSADSSGYRSALETTYGIPATELENQWRAWLPAYLDGTSASAPPVVGYDLSYPRQLLNAGRYAEAQAELEQVIERLQNSPQEEVLGEAQAMLDMSRNAQKADEIAAQARDALAASDYEQARALVQQAREAYDAVGETRQAQVLDVYAARIERGERANTQLQEAAQLASSLRLPEARDTADAAAAEFARLGDTGRLSDAQALRHDIDNTQRLVGLSLVMLGVLGILLSLWGRWSGRKSEVW